MSRFNQREWDRGWKDGAAAYFSGLPQRCPVMPEAVEEAPGLPGYVDSWLLSWGEHEMAERAEKAYLDGWHAAWQEGTGACPYLQPRLREAWISGYAEGSAGALTLGVSVH